MILLLIILSYLLGSIPFALIIGKTFYQTDVRQHGSGNLGATNTLHILGVKAGIAVMIGDVSKGILAASLPYFFGTEIHPIYIGIFAVIGHCFPIFAGFRGGKAIATSAGVFIFVNPLIFLIGAIAFFGLIWLTKYVVFGSLGAGLAVFIASLFMQDVTLIIITGALIPFLLFLHRSNIRNLLNGVEPKTTSRKIKK